MNAFPEFHASRRFARSLLIGNLIVAALLVTLAAMVLQDSRAAYAERARNAAESLAASLQHGIATELALVDMVLRDAQSDLRQLPRPEGDAIEASLRAHQALFPAIESLRITDARGVVRHGQGVPPGSPSDLSGRDIFRLVRDQPGADLAISEPERASGSRKWVIALARRIETPDGRFAGMVCADLAVDHFQRMFDGVDVGEDGAIGLRTASLRLVALKTREGLGDFQVGSPDASPQFAQAVRAAPQRGFYLSPATPDRPERATAYRQVGNHPLTVLVGLGSREYFAPWHALLANLAGLIAVVMLVVAGISWLAYAAWRREADGAKALAIQGRRHQGLMRTAIDGIHVLDSAGRVEELSDSFARMLGYTREEMLGRHVGTWDALLRPGEIDEQLATFKPGRLSRFETVHRRRDGSLIEVEIQAAAVQIDARTLYYCSARDITERNQLLTRLAASAREFRDLYDNAPCGYYSLDAQGRFVHVNAVALSWFGCSADDVIGKESISRFLSDEGQELFRRHFERLKEEGQVDDLEFDIVSLSGQRRRVRLSATALRDEQGRFQMTRTVMHDVTELRQAQQMQIKAVELQAENRQLLEASRVKAAFLGNMSHELRTPLNAILGFAHLLASGKVPPQSPRQDQYLQQIESSGRKLLGLIDALLQFSRREAQKSELQPRRIHLPALFAGAAALFETECAGKRIDWRMEIDPSLGDALLDPLLLEQMLFAYLSNAVKFTPAGGCVTLRASAQGEAQPEGGRHDLRVEVEDTGIGIAAADQPKVFTEFMQLSSGSTKRYEGMGIGLALTRRLVEAQGGSVGVRSEPGVGSVFHLVLPGVLIDPVPGDAVRPG